MALTLAEIQAQILTTIIPNGIGSITGQALQDILADMTVTLNGSSWMSPVDPSVTQEDVGKLMMNDGTTGLAKVYRLNPPQIPQLGMWTIIPQNAGNFATDTGISINTGGNQYTYTREDWEPGPVDPATTVPLELGYILSFLSAQPQFSGILNFYLSSDQSMMYIAELVFNGTTVYVSNLGGFPLQVTQNSLPALPALPTSFPLGKLLGITDTNQAIISCNPIETFYLSTPIPSSIMNGTFGVINSLFSYNYPLSINSVQTLYNLLSQIIIPADNGLVIPFDITQLNLTGGSVAQLRYHFLGLAISASATTVSVYRTPLTSLILSLILKASQEGIAQIFTGNTLGTGSGSGSGSGSGFGS